MRNKLVISLEELLAQHDCVAVPGLGAFIHEHIPASWDAEHRLAYPPGVVLRFNEALQHQDGLLMEYYATTLGISLRRAKLEIEQDVRQLRQLLLRQQSANLPGLGILRLSPEGRLSFHSQVSDKIAQPYYGLQAVISPIGKAKSQIEDEANLDEFPNKDYIQLNIPKSALRYAAVAAVLALLFILPFSIWPERNDSYQASFVPDKETVAKIVEPITSPSIEVEQEQLGEVVSPIVEGKAGLFYVIIGSERREDVALNYLDRYKAEYPQMCILQGKKILRISVADFTTAQEAQATVNELSGKGISAWVYHL